MDIETIEVYNNNAETFCERYNSISPTSLYDTIKRHFHSNGLTADIGCGSGRDVAWLNLEGYPTTGYDASENMLHHARRTFPQYEFKLGILPDLHEIESDRFSNVLCNAVLMHLSKEEISTSLTSLSRILQPKGHLIISFRKSLDADEREEDGRLFTPVSTDEMSALLESVGFHILTVAEQPDATRVDVVWIVIAGEIA